MKNAESKKSQAFYASQCYYVMKPHKQKLRTIYYFALFVIILSYHILTYF